MKTDAILSRVHEILAISEEPTPSRQELKKLADDLAAQVRLECAAQRGAGNAARTIVRMLNAQKKHDNRTALHYAWIDAKGRQCVCDGYRAFRLNDPLPLEERPADAGDPVDLDKIMPDDVPAGYDSLPLPSAQELKAHIALERAAHGRKHTPLWDFGHCKPLVYAEQLLDLLAVLPDAKEIFFKPGASGIFSLLYAKGERGDAALMPIRSQQKVNEFNAAHAAELRAAQDADEARKDFRAHLEDYQRQADADSTYSITPDEFERLSRHAYQPAV